MCTLLCFVLLFACKPKKIDIPINADLPFKNEIAAYTSGRISKNGHIKIVIKDTIPTYILNDLEAAKEYIKTTPNFSFSVEKEGEKTLKLMPQRTFDRGTLSSTSISISNKGIKMTTRYYSSTGNYVNPDSFVFGQDYKVTVSIKNMDTKNRINNIALSNYSPEG